MIVVPRPTNKSIEVFEFHGVQTAVLQHDMEACQRAEQQSHSKKVGRVQTSLCGFVGGNGLLQSAKENQDVQECRASNREVDPKALSISISLHGQYVSTSQSADGLYVPLTLS
jgi:hypothetical protein